MSSNAGKEQKAHPAISFKEVDEMCKLHIAETRFKAQLITMEKSKIMQEGEFLLNKGEGLYAQAEQSVQVAAIVKLLNSARNNLQHAEICFDKWEELREVETARRNINPEMTLEDMEMSQNNDTV